ncbi:MAG: hypothetical protein ACI4T7_03085, partial [Alloprevotella sp.]
MMNRFNRQNRVGWNEDENHEKQLVLCGPAACLICGSRGVLQNARRVRRKAKINEAIINRAFCKTPLLAAVGFRPPHTEQGKNQEK